MPWCAKIVNFSTLHENDDHENDVYFNIRLHFTHFWLHTKITQNRHFWNMHNFGQKKYFSQKIFFNNFSWLIQKIFSGIFFFPDSNFRVLTFFRLFFEKILFGIFFLILSLETSDLARTCYFWCFSRKND
jgi:hypothetical protein